MYKVNEISAKRLLESDDPEELKGLLKLADAVREETVRQQVCIHGIIEFSNHCQSLCAYCGIRGPNKTLQRYQMSPEEIRDTALTAVKVSGYKMLVLQSGEDPWYDTDRLIWIIRKIKSDQAAKCLVFLSIGNRDYETYETLYRAGARGVLFRFETSDPDLYKKLHPDCNLEERLEHLRYMKEIGYLTASGPLIGLPGQTIDSLVQDIFFMRDLGLAMASMGPFIPAPNTPLAGEKPGDIKTVIMMIALTRLIYPHVRIPITTALEKLGGMAVRRTALTGGANAFMLNLTPAQYRENYDIYPGKNLVKTHIHSLETVEELTKLISSCGRRVCKGWGTDFTLTKEDFNGSCNTGLTSSREMRQ